MESLTDDSGTTYDPSFLSSGRHCPNATTTCRDSSSFSNKGDISELLQFGASASTKILTGDYMV